MRKKITIALDAAHEMMGLSAGHQVSFNDGLPTVDDGLAFYISQLSSVEAKLYETKYRNIVYSEFVPVDTSDPEWIDQATYFHYDAVTVGKFIGANARDLPKSDIEMGKTTTPVFYGGNSYGYSLDELRKSQAMGLSLDTAKAAASYRGFQEHVQRVVFKGDADRNISGLFDNTNIQKDVSTVDWSTASGQEIVGDCNGLLIRVWQNSAETHIPNVLLIPSEKWAIISNKRMDAGTDTTVLEFLRLNNLYKDITGQELTIKPNFELKTANTAGDGPRMMAYELNDENLGMKMPILWRSLAPQPDGLMVDVPAEYKFGGVFFRYPGSAAYRDFA
jgi:hypothetical protein